MLAGVVLAICSVAVVAMTLESNRRMGAAVNAQSREQALSNLLQEVKEFRAVALAFAVTRRRTQEELLQTKRTGLESRLASATELSEDVKAAIAPLLADYSKVMAQVAEELGSANRNRGVATYQNMALPLEGRIEEVIQTSLAHARATSDAMTLQVEKAKDILLVILGISALAIIICVLILCLSFLRTLRLFTAMGAFMTNLANGDLASKIPGIGRRDEVGSMAGAVDFFRQQAVEKNRMDLARIAEQAIRETRQKETEELTREFTDTIGSSLDSLIAASEAMRTTADAMGHSAARTDHDSTEVAVGASEAAETLVAVAAAAEEVVQNAIEVTSQVQQANTTLTDVTGLAQGTAQRVTELRTATEDIRSVIASMRQIADQTNLLALNATIEAARSGEAGKGFAVVATEVKTLALQAARASEDVSARMEILRRSSDSTCQDISSIGRSIASLGNAVRHITFVIEQQGHATSSIVQKVQILAQATNGTAEKMRNVSFDAKSSGQAAGQVLDASASVATEAKQLEAKINSFIDRKERLDAA
jgi:methyl-accepting chemotaxis protein